MGVDYIYRLRCLTEAEYKYITKSANEDPPVACPDQSSHDLDNEATAIVEIIQTNN